MIYLLSLLGIFKKSEHRTSTEIWEQRWRMRRGRQENKEKEGKILESQKGRRVQDVLISSSHCQQQAEKWCGRVTLWSSSDEWTSVHGPPATIRTLNTNGPIGLSVVELCG